MRVEAVHEATPQLLAALARLLPQLNPKLRVPDLERLQRLIADSATTLLVATEGDEIVGTTTVIVYTIPFWFKARLDEAVVDESARRQSRCDGLGQTARPIGPVRGAQAAAPTSGCGPKR